MNGQGWRTAAAAAVLGAVAVGAGAARAEPTYQTLFSYKAWEVQVVAFDDGTLACLAQVSDPGDSFSIWTYPDESVRLQFFSTAWEFGEGNTADLELQIDRRGPWSLTNAELYLNSVLFTIPDGDAGVRFIVEVARGNTLYLRAADGTNVMSYSLAGSHASINALIECGDALLDPSPQNPFN
jgi:hypothetical protein